MKIALYVHCFFPTHFYGTEAYTLALAKELTALGHDCIIVSTTLWGEPAQRTLVEEYSYDGLRVISIDKNLYREQRVKDTYEQPTLRHVHERILRKLKPDLVHVCHLISHTSALLEVTRRLGIPTFATLTDFFGFCYNNVLENTRHELCAGPGATRANCIACFLKLEAARAGATLPARLANFPAFRPTVAHTLAFLGRGDHDGLVIDGFIPNDIVVRPGILRRAMGSIAKPLRRRSSSRRRTRATTFRRRCASATSASRSTARRSRRAGRQASCASVSSARSRRTRASISFSTHSPAAGATT